MEHLPNIGLVIGLALLWPSIWSIRSVWKQTHGHSHLTRRRVRITTVVLGVAFVLPAISISYLTNSRTRVFGFPFLSVVFQKRGEMWLDYLGPFTVPALLLNGFLGFALPFLFVAIWLRFFKPAVGGIVSPQQLGPPAT